ncbi:MAG: hypothetical protein CEE43_00020 [Promethearchaeota archaeon Loki_b32]|nr:MAG: hypothetical protein CEE43_00020 [Candidatus Lokiarchaeota archaeon Loki_b32]
MNFCTKCGNKLEEHWVICPSCGTSLKELKEIEEQEIIIPHQITTINKNINKEKRFVKNKKVFVLSISLIVVCVLAGVLGILYIQINNRYNDLSGDYEDLEQGYDDLLDDYNELFTDYNFLFGEYYSILSVLEDPLTNPVIPTISQVQNWLAIDDTDDMSYTENWMCGDFSAMLMVRAKAMNWRMRIACMFYSYNGDFGWQDPSDPYGSYGHAFNLIYCQDGSDSDNYLDVYYIEPQSDGVWYVHYGDYNHVHYEIWWTFTGGISGTVWQEPYYVNHYSYLA